ncbi:histidinol-phosphate transaminase [Bizionia sediminis]|uniref:Histidinol-phosphate aminotransferase n=1 Tax=Bizionia sediminis TaxID=1737064 RepID=A0ABW5KPH0_9FLAO
MMLTQLIRPNIKALQPYTAARDIYNTNQTNYLFLDANENPNNNGLNRYPDPQQTALKQRLAAIKGIQTNALIIGNGSDEILDLLFRVFCEPNKDAVLIVPPTYGMYEVLANINAVNTIKVPLTSTFQLPVSAILAAATTNCKLLFLCSPNNPTANSFQAADVETLLQKFNGIVVIDEAYIDFSDTESWLTRLDDFPNLVVIQTLSKAIGLAGIRVGLGMASAEIIALLNRIKPPYNINQLSQEIALTRLENIPLINSEIEQLKQERKRLIKAFRELKVVVKVHPSDANFLLIEVDNAAKRYQQLLKLGILVRDRSQELGCTNCLRISIGTPSENNQLLAVLRQLAK